MGLDGFSRWTATDVPELDREAVFNWVEFGRTIDCACPDAVRQAIIETQGLDFSRYSATEVPALNRKSVLCRMDVNRTIDLYVSSTNPF